MKRLFTALPLDEAFIKTFAKYRDTYGKISYLRWVPVQNFHITTLFIGAVPDKKVSKIEQALHAVASETQTFALTFDGIIYAPPEPTKKTMVWASFKQSNAYNELVARTADAITGITTFEEIFKNQKNGKGKEKVIHATLARLRDEKNPPRERVALKQPERAPHSLEVNEFLLMESHLLPDRVQYSVRERFPFRGESTATDGLST